MHCIVGKVRRVRFSAVILIFVSLMLVYPVCRFVYKVYEYRVGFWFGAYIQSLFVQDRWYDSKQRHVVIVLADHHEPGAGVSGVDKSKNWCDVYLSNMGNTLDHYGNAFRYTFFMLLIMPMAGQLKTSII